MKLLTKFFILIFLLSACGQKNPEWIKGEWCEKHTNKADIYTTWKFTNSGIYWKTNKVEYRQCESTIMVTLTAKDYGDEYRLKWENATDKEPYFEIFQKVNSNEIIYHDSIKGQVGKKSIYELL